MKTVLFIYFDIALGSYKCDSYVVRNIEECIKWRLSIYSKEIDRGEISHLSFRVVDSIRISTMQTM